jgi:hypothetical protein
MGVIQLLWLRLDFCFFLKFVFWLGVYAFYCFVGEGMKVASSGIIIA